VPYVPGFTHDVFVSYAHGPSPSGKRAELIREWTHSFVDDLQSQLDVLLGTKDQKRRVSIFIDRALDGNRPLSEGLTAKAKQSALLLVVMSHYYLDSPWCRDELKWFSDQAGSNDKVFVVKAFNPHSPDDALSNGALHADSDIGISTLFWIERGGDGKPGG
jgi:hypothetical protein